MSAARFAPGDPVMVKALFPPGHVRTPFFVRGKAGRIEALAGSFGDPERLAYGDPQAPDVPLYRVRFAQAELWPGYAGPAGDGVTVDLFQGWLEPLP